MNKVIVLLLSIIMGGIFGCSTTTNKQIQKQGNNSQIQDGVLMEINDIGKEENLDTKTLLNQTPIEQGQNINMIAYIAFKDDKLIIDEIELIKLDNDDRVKELGKKVSKDMRNGYHIYNESQELLEIVISPNIIYRFTDKNGIYKTIAEDKIYETDKLEQFYQASEYKEGTTIGEQTIPYFIEIIDGKVAKITEEFEYTE